MGVGTVRSRGPRLEHVRHGGWSVFADSSDHEAQNFGCDGHVRVLSCNRRDEVRNLVREDLYLRSSGRFNTFNDI